MKAERRKMIAMRSPSVSLPPSSTSEPHLRQKSSMPASGAVHDHPPATFGSPALQSLIYATSNDRYPGAPGTLLHRAKLEAARALAAKQREAQREVERREEMKRLGILGVGKKRSTTAAAAAAAAAASALNGNGRSATSPASDRARRSNGVATVTPHVNGNGGTSTRPGRANGAARSNHNAAANAIDHDALPVPATSSSSSSSSNGRSHDTPANGASVAAAAAIHGAASPLLSASGRLRRPATGSRGASPMPLTGNSTGMMTRTRSPVVPPLELDEDQKAPGTLTGTLGSVQGTASSVMV